MVYSIWKNEDERKEKYSSEVGKVYKSMDEVWEGIEYKYNR